MYTIRIFSWFPQSPGLTARILVLFSTLCCLYVIAAGYWGVIIAGAQPGITIFIVIILVSVWAVIAARGPAEIVASLKEMGQSEMLNPFRSDGFAYGD